jgi:hypothetical protein
MKKYCVKIRYQGEKYPEDNIEIVETNTLKSAKEYANKKAIGFDHGRVLEVFKLEG